MAGHVRKVGERRYIARFPLGPRGKYRSRTFERKIDASEWLKTQNQRRDRGDWVDPRHSAETFGEVAGSWLGSRRSVAPSTLARDRSYYRNLIEPYLGDYELRYVSPEVLDEWVRLLDEVEQKAPATTRKAFQIVSMVLDRAVATRKLAANPAKVGEAIDLPAPDTSEMRFLSVGEVAELSAAVDPRYRGLVLAGAYSGLRWGELAGLRAKYLDLDAARLTVAESLSEVAGTFRHKAPKSAAARRSITLPGVAVVALEQHLANRPAIGDALVFTDSRGGPLRRSNFHRRYWRPAVLASVGEPCRVHDLRHTHAAMLIAGGEHPKVIQSRLGHASIKTTLDTYGHLFDGLDEGAAARLDAMVAQAVKHSGSTQPTATIAQLGDRAAKSLGTN